MVLGLAVQDFDRVLWCLRWFVTLRVWGFGIEQTDFRDGCHARVRTKLIPCRALFKTALVAELLDHRLDGDHQVLRDDALRRVIQGDLPVELDAGELQSLELIEGVLELVPAMLSDHLRQEEGILGRQRGTHTGPRLDCMRGVADAHDAHLTVAPLLQRGWVTIQEEAGIAKALLWGQSNELLRQRVALLLSHEVMGKLLHVCLGLPESSVADRI